MHARVGAAIERLRPDAVPRWPTTMRAGSGGDRRGRPGYAIRAAELADRRYAYDTAVSFLAQAAEASARIPGPADERAERDVSLLGRLLRAVTATSVRRRPLGARTFRLGGL